MRRFCLTPEAVADLDEILEYYADKSPAYAERLVAQIEKRCRLLAHSPMMGTPRERFGPGVRTSAVAPYVIYFRPDDDGVQILRIFHGARDIDAGMMPG
jgi:toxin ParE1/3/4